MEERERTEVSVDGEEGQTCVDGGDEMREWRGKKGNKTL